MRRLFSSIVLSVFFIWILPLGVFIKPSQEKMACAGQRAICLCSNLLNKSAEKAAPVNSFRTAASAGQKESSAGAFSHYFSPGKFSDTGSLVRFRFSHNESFLYSFRFIKPIEHVPKA